MDAKGKFEISARVDYVEQQLGALPAAWKTFAGAPMEMNYYGTRINTFRKNPQLERPSTAYCNWAVRALREKLGDGATGLSDTELRDIVSQEWRSDLARNVMQARLNRHGSPCGPVVQRSARGILSVVAAPSPTSTKTQGARISTRQAFVVDAIANPPREKGSRESTRGAT